MLPLRLVLDTNILVSAAIKPDSLQRTAFLLAITKPARLYVSEPLLQEYATVLSRPELSIRRGRATSDPNQAPFNWLENAVGKARIGRQ
ncbi:MAG: PIN domain-containing protein [Acidobacteriaceae bacterium]|jgi:predicted nucleic acid-binding protein